MPAPSITEVVESDLVDLLYRELWSFQNIAIPPKTPWPSDYYLRVQPQDLGFKSRPFGDVDALLVPHGDHSSVRAIEFKRVKIPEKSFATCLANKLCELPKAVKQANALYKTGFAHVWLIVLVVTDSRVPSVAKKKWVDAPAEIMDQVKSRVCVDSLLPGVGIHIVNITQHLDHPVTEAGMFGGHILRLATIQQQPGYLTAAISQLCRTASRK